MNITGKRLKRAEKILTSLKSNKKQSQEDHFCSITGVQAAILCLTFNLHISKPI